MAVALALCGARAAELEPVRDIDGLCPNECSIGIWVNFPKGGDGEATAGSPTGLFSLSLDADNRPMVTFRAEPTEILGDYTIKARDPVTRGDWYHFAITYSLMRKRACLFVQGRFQFENDTLYLPKLAKFSKKDFGKTKDFRGEVRGLTIWDAALGSESIVPAGDHKSNPLDTIGRRRADLRRRTNLSAVANAGTAEAALFVTPPYSGEPVMPYELPADGVLTNVAGIVTAPGETEDVSFVLVAKKPVVVSGVEIGQFKASGGRAADVAADVRVVKRWFRTGGAWQTYHSDRRQRLLVPDLLLHDDAAVRVDELRRRNYIRLEYPEGTIYADVSDPAKGHKSWQEAHPFSDAKSLQPVEIAEAGRNQQFLVTLSVAAGTEPGLYEAPVLFKTANGGVEAKIAMRVLDVALPAEPSPYGLLDKVYISHMNHYPADKLVALEPRLAERREMARRIMRDFVAHRINHGAHVWKRGGIAELAFEAGMVPDFVFGSSGGFEGPRDWREFYKGEDQATLTAAERDAGIRAVLREKEEASEWFTNTFPSATRQMSIFISESGSYQAINWRQEECGEAAHALGQRVFAHGMSERNSLWGSDKEDIDISTRTNPELAQAWRAVGGGMMNYAAPFPGAENPLIFRYLPGWMMYRSGLVGHMLHGYLNTRTPFNEWAFDYGGDGNYRNFTMVYPQKGGVINTLAWEGLKAGYDDLRWLTRLCQLADAFKDSDDHDLRSEAKRQLRWVESLRPWGEDIDMIRAGAQHRILIMQDAILRHGHPLPPVDRAYAKVLKRSQH